ncbi:MAG: CinA family nicotinamide mononucleotide deamidase-related protein, partial [Deferribacterales bacterium]
MSVTAAIFAIGTEIFLGSIVDTNSSYIAKRLSEAGVDVKLIRPLPDQLDFIVDVIKGAFDDYNIIITTGGLGPTFDDLTAEAVSKAAGMNTVFNETAYLHIEGLLKKRGVQIKESHKRQAYLPEKCELLPNNYGTAMGFIVEKNNSYSISLPGIPYEMKPMFEDYVLPFIRTRFNLPTVYMDDFRFSGLPESDVDEVIRDIGIPEDVETIINVSKGEIIVRLKSLSQESFEYFSAKIVEKLKRYYIGKGDESLEVVLVNMLKDRRLTISFAESCTGGLLSKKITDVSGSSKVFLGSIIAYSNDVKISMLGVNPDTINQYGAVSAEVAIEMAKG